MMHTRLSVVADAACAIPRQVVVGLLVITLMGPGATGQALAQPSGSAAPTSRLVTVTRDVQYGTADGTPLLLDAYVPDGGPYPAVLLLHEGGWATEGKRAFAPEAARLAQGGFVAFAVNYRLSPPGGRWHFPAAVDDVRTAVRWVRANAAVYHVDPNRIGALGASAGANLALLLATTGQPGVDRVAAAVSWSAPTELRALVPSQAATPAAEQAAARDPAYSTVLNYMGCRPSTCPASYVAASPYDHVDASTAPIYLANSTQEIVPLAQATDMAAKLQAVGVPHQLRVLDGHRHARAYEAQVWDESVRFLQAHLAT